MSILLASLLWCAVAGVSHLTESAFREPPVVATHYFYWYRWPDSHFDQPGAPGREGHTHLLPNPELVDWRSPAWHEAQFRAMGECGIDVALPVYWGAPGAYDRPGTRFSVEGLGPMAQALDAIAASGGTGVKLGLFYDTSTLRRSVRGLAHDDARPDRPDLTTAQGKALFADTIVEYFARIPPRHWARFHGRPLVVTYVSGFAGKWDDTLGPALRTAFAARFPDEVPFLVADASWGEIGQDLQTSWGAALTGPKLFPSVAQVGPGYDDSPVPGRRTPIRLREDGAFYRWSWRAAVASAPALVLVETWNELHEGTEICETIPTGRLYLDLTREWTRRLRTDDPGPSLPPPVSLQLRPDLSWGAEARDSSELHVDYTGEKVARHGLREFPWEDGPFAIENGALRSDPSTGRRVTYLYFQISDHWRFDDDDGEHVGLKVSVRCDGDVELQYDSHRADATLDGAYAPALLSTVRVGRNGAPNEYLFHLPRARLANRQNGGADFRLVVTGDPVAIEGIRVHQGRGR